MSGWYHDTALHVGISGWYHNAAPHFGTSGWYHDQGCKKSGILVTGLPAKL
jgi:hypothetical protein